VDALFKKEDEMNYWFKTKKYGWGWTPANYKGWLVILFFIITIISLTPILKNNPTRYVEYTIFLILALILISYKTGEPTRWRWGD